MVHCSLPGCDSKEKKGMSFFRFPVKERSMWEKWKQILERFYKEIDLDIEKIFDGKICYLHFKEKHIIWHDKLRKRFLTEEAIPINFKNIDMQQAKLEPKGERLPTKLKRTPTTRSKSNNKTETCRLCLKSAEKPKAITQITRENIELLISSSLNPNFSNLICDSCLNAVETFVDFREKVLKNQEKLLRDCPVVEIKTEAKHNDEDDLDDPNFSFPNGSPASDYQETENSMKNTKKRGYSQVKTEVIAESTGDGKNLQDNSDNDMTDGSWNLDKTEEKKKKRYKKGKYGEMTCKEYAMVKIPCERCGKFVATIRMEAHVAQQHRRMEVCKYQCDICGSKFFQKYLMKNHIECHLPSQEIKCEICQKSYRSVKQKTNHIRRVHQRVGKIVCETCGKICFRKSSLERHVLEKHKKEANLKCDFPGCSKTFFTARDKHIHESYTHSGPKTCQDCGKTCVSKSALRKHRKQHEGVAIYCDFVVNGVPCNKVFFEESRLKVHQRVHSEINEFFCPQCPAQYKNKRPLTMHFIAEHSTFRFTCIVVGCDANFLRKDYLRNHVKAHHSHFGEDFLKEALQRVTDMRVPKLEELRSDNQ